VLWRLFFSQVEIKISQCHIVFNNFKSSNPLVAFEVCRVVVFDMLVNALVSLTQAHRAIKETNGTHKSQVGLLNTSPTLAYGFNISCGVCVLFIYLYYITLFTLKMEFAGSTMLCLSPAAICHNVINWLVN
jgi:hypothetical protein